MKRLLSGILLLLCAAAATAEDILTVRSTLEFGEALPRLEALIEAHGYRVAHVQKCDSGLQGFGYQTDRYRVVFFGKHDEVRKLTAEFPELIPFLPLKFALFAEGDQTIVNVLNPVALGEYYPDPRLLAQFRHWETDLRAMLRELTAMETAEAGKLSAE